MLDKKTWFSIYVIPIVVSLFFVPNFAFANGWGYTWYDMVILSPILYPFSFLSIAVVYVVIKLLKSFKPSLGNYIHSSRLLKIGLYSSAWVHSWVIYHIIIPAFLDKSIRFNDEMFYDFLFRLVIPGIIIISIVIINHFVLKKVPTAIVVTVVVLLIFVSIFIIYQTQNPGIPTRTLIESITVSGLKMWVHGTDSNGLAWGAFAVRNTGDKVLSVDRIVVRGADVPFGQWYADKDVTSALIQQAMKFPGWLGTGGNLAVDDPDADCASELIRIDLDGAGGETAVCADAGAGPIGLDPGNAVIIYFKLTNNTLSSVDGGAQSSVSVFAGKVGAPQSISIASKT